VVEIRIVANDNFNGIYVMKISIFALDGVFDTGIAVLLDAFRLANVLSACARKAEHVFELNVIGLHQPINTSQGFIINAINPPPLSKPDWVIVPALACGTPEQLLSILARPDTRQACVLLQDWHAAGARIAAACIGTFILAESGLLDQQPATTTWWLSPVFRQRYPSVLLDESRMLVESGQVLTAGAAMGHLDLALWVIRHVSPKLADTVSRHLLANLRSLQAAFIIPSQLAQADPLIQRFEHWARSHLKQGFSLQKAAAALAVSPRTLQRRCQAVLGKSPLAYFQDLRIERAQSMLQGGQGDLPSIASEVGYEDGATLGALIRQKLGRNVRDIRAEMRHASGSKPD